jgi:hypothetical protein
MIGHDTTFAQIFQRQVLSGDSSMLDVLMVALALGFFALSVSYAYACDRL